MSNKDYWSSFLITILPFVILCYVSCSNGPREVTNKNFLADCLYQTNHYRRMHGVPSMTMDKEASKKRLLISRKLLNFETFRTSKILTFYRHL